MNVLNLDNLHLIDHLDKLHLIDHLHQNCDGFQNDDAHPVLRYFHD